jgi:hypothetical protein
MANLVPAGCGADGGEREDLAAKVLRDIDRVSEVIRERHSGAPEKDALGRVSGRRGLDRACGWFTRRRGGGCWVKP